MCINPPGVRKTGSMFGEGLYFSESVSKSSYYSYRDLDKCENINCFLFLGEVALGDMLVFFIGKVDAKSSEIKVYSFLFHQARTFCIPGIFEGSAERQT